MTDMPTSDELATMNLVQLLDALAPITPPADIAMTPQTPAWAVLALGAFGGLSALVLWAMRRHRATAYRRAGLAALRNTGDDPARIAIVLRRTALAAFPRAQVAGLHGRDWVAFLTVTAPGAGMQNEACATALIEGPFRPVPPNPDLTARAAVWIRTHRAQLAPEPSAPDPVGSTHRALP